MPGWIARLRGRLTRFVDHGSEGASPARALMVRRARGFGLVALAIHAVILAITLPDGQVKLAALAGAGMLVYAACMRWMSREHGRYAPAAAHVSIGCLMATISASALQVGGASATSTTYPCLLILGTMHVLGVRAAALWTGVALACLAGLIFTATLPADPQGGWRPGHGVVFTSRATVLLGVFAIAALGRRFEDRQTAQLQFLARHDPLTGLYNRRELDRRVGDALARAARYGRRPALLYLDLDGFKQVNDQYGHPVGDEVLRSVSAVIRGQTRRTDAAGRVGGDELVLLLEDAGDEKTAASYAERLLESLAATEIDHPAPIRVRCSLGVAVYPDDGTTAETLTRAADAAMYAAKRAGGGRVVLASAG